MSVTPIRNEYEEFLKSKRREVPEIGPSVEPDELHHDLFPFQRSLVAWAVRKGRAALFADTGLGKTIMQLEWARALGERTLILAPLAVAAQTVAEGAHWGIHVTYARKQSDAAPTGITITNYEMADKFDASAFGAVVLDESSILKNYTGTMKKALIAQFRETRFRLCCTATPAPNDTVELCNHADFLGIMTPAEMLATFFTPKGSKQDGTGHSLQAEHAFRLKGHARDEFWRWMASWAMAIKKPSDLGFDDTGYDLPALTIEPIYVDSGWKPTDQLMFTRLRGVTDRSQARKGSLIERVAAAAEIINREPNEPWLIWCGLNDEATALMKAVPGSIQVQGSDSPEVKAERLLGFANGGLDLLITKPSIAGFGLNFQRCARMIFVGISDSYEQYYQAIRRCYRFGQLREVKAYIVLSDVESDVYNNVKRKESEAGEMSRELIRHIAAFERAEIERQSRSEDKYQPRQPIIIPSWLTSEALSA